MAMIATLRWRARGADAELLLTLGTQDSKIRAYVVDGPALVAPERHQRFLNLLRKLHGTEVSPAAVFLLGAADSPGLVLPEIRHGDQAQREHPLERIQQILADPPAYGPWWGPTRRAIEVFWGSSPEYARYPFEVALLLGNRAVLPYEWDAGPPAPPFAARFQPKVLVVGGQELPDGAEALSWEDFFTVEEQSFATPKGKGPALFTFTSPRASDLRLTDKASRQGWSLESGETCAVLEHPAFQFPQGGGAFPLAVLAGAGEQASSLPRCVFAAGTRRFSASASPLA